MANGERNQAPPVLVSSYFLFLISYFAADAGGGGFRYVA